MLRLDKDTIKTRILFVAAVKFEDVSLNAKIHQGPELQSYLCDELLRFRRLPIVVVCAIEEMYQRIGIAHAEK